ncbi:hypothetical protein IGB42_02910 [Andreprevotia sp. IGB-42]|uniref:cytoplasmic protein n=1 Tax=Andreprevotia sp. IGB-42 TaxID=2497473 RepID=UPI00135708D5|nr:cytoplasmic protein [Andreprevotia sp. IGB-42]KAF0812618.1 hypothetical protein IGB42_02910 [Andreprevotia sp. IGB-42]
MTAIIAAHEHSIYHRKALQQSDLCGCLHCLAIFPPDAIEEWTDFPEDATDEPLGNTALCPACSIDPVIGSAPGYSVTPEFLAQTQAHRFRH